MELVLCMPALGFLVNKMESLSVRQKQRAWSGSHTVNTKANHRGYPIENWWAHYTGCALCFLEFHQSLKQQAEKENWVWDALSARREELSGYGSWKWLTHHPSPPAAPTADFFLCDEAVTAYMGITKWPRNAWHTELCITLQNHLGPILNPLLSSQHQKDCIITVRCKPHLQYFGLLLRDVSPSVYRYQALWE